VHLISEVGVGTTFWFDLTTQPLDRIESLMAEMEAEADSKHKKQKANSGDAPVLTPASND
jgi:hypothetical protein